MIASFMQVFKQYVRDEYDNYALRADGTPPSRQLLANWIVAARGMISPALIVQAFISAGITTPNDYVGTEFANALNSTSKWLCWHWH